MDGQPEVGFPHLFSKRQNHKADCANFVAFSEKLNFTNEKTTFLCT